MRAMILAAGLGQRMGALTQTCPKPLLKIAGRHLIEYAITAIVDAGIQDIVINTSYHGDQIRRVIGSGTHFGANIVYSHEIERLETGGGIVNALPLLGRDPFLVMSSDIVSTCDLACLPKMPEGLAHLLMVDNPAYHPDGDYGLRHQYLDTVATPKMTYANIGVFRPELFTGYQPVHFPLNQVLLPAIRERQVTGERLQGKWYNVGTPADIELVETVVRTHEGRMKTI